MAKRKPIPKSAWKSRGTGANAFVALSPKFRVGEGVRAAVDIPYPDVVVPVNTTGVVTDVTEFGNAVFYFVAFDGDSIDRLARENQLKK